MEGPLEVKSSNATTEEPIKSEAIVESPDSSGRSDGAASPPPNCSICLGKLVNTSFTDSCLHQFCFTCLLQWSKIKTECPLCKQTFKSIIHNVRSEEDYDQYHVPRELATQMSQPQVMATLDFNLEWDGNWDVGVRRFLYRTTMTGNRRTPTLLNPAQVARREQLPSIAPQVSREERRRRRANPADYRRTVYRLGIYATSLPDVFGRFRECSAEYYRRQPRELDRLVPWLNRELQVLLNNNAPHVAYVMRIIMDALTQYDIRSPQFRDLVRGYFGVHTDHFVHELLNYARTNFDLVGYDQSVTYLPQGLSNEYVSRLVSPTPSSTSDGTSSDDSDVRVLDEAIDLRVNTELPGVGPHTMNMPGPSTVGQAFQVDPPYNVPDVLTISSNSSTSDDECEVVGYVKPRHERTPEIIELLSSDPEDATVSHIPEATTEPQRSLYDDCFQSSTSQNTKRRATRSNREAPIRHHSELSEIQSTSSTSEDSDSDSDYSPQRNRRYRSRTKKSSKKSTNDRRHAQSSTRSRKRSVRNLSSSGESDTRKRGSRKSSRLKKAVSSSSESSFHESGKKKADDERTRKGKYSTREMVRVRKDLIKTEERYTDAESSSSSDSSSEIENKSRRSRGRRKSKRKYSSSSSNSDGEKSEKLTRSKDKSRQSTETASKDAGKREHKHKEKRRSTSRSSSESSYMSEKNKRSSCRWRDSKRDTSECDSQDDSNSANRTASRSEHSFKALGAEGRSDSDNGRCRSSSQCSNHSSKSYVHWKRAKHKDRYKDKDRKRSNFNPFQSASSTSSVTSSSSKNNTHSISKHSDSKSSSTSKEKYKSRKNRKESNHRRSQSEAKSKSKKKRRRIRSSSSSNSD